MAAREFVSQMSIGQVFDWLRATGQEGCIQYFEYHKIDGQALLELTEDLLRSHCINELEAHGKSKFLFHLTV